MKDWLIIGMALGFLVGAVLVEGNKKVEETIRCGKNLVANKVKQLVTDSNEKPE